MISKLVLRSPARYWNLAALARLLRVLAWMWQGLRLTAAATVLIIAVQLLYPGQIARPFTRLDGQAVSFWSKGRLIDLAAANGQKPYTLAVDGHGYKQMPSSIGIASDNRATASRVLKYGLSQRLVPLSIVFHRDYTTRKRINDQVLQRGLQEFADSKLQDPIDASVIKKDGVYTAIQPEKSGYSIDTERLRTYVLKAPFAATIQVPRKALQPAITRQMEQAVLTSWQQQTGQLVILHTATGTITIAVDVLRKWVVISTNQQQDNVFLTYDQAAIRGWLNAYAASVAISPKPTMRYIQDNVLINTTNGSNGSVLDLNGSATNIINALKDPSRSALMQMTPVAFTTQEVRSYTATSKGIQAIIDNWSSRYKGMTAAVSFQEINGQSRAASLHDTQPFFTASIYKLFIALYVYKQIEANNLSLSSVVSGNTTIDACLEAMIVVSDNNCPHEIADQLGWANIDSFVKQQGFGATSIVSGNPSTDTADVAKFLVQLYAGGLMNADHSSALLDKMGRQIYRSAIPAGSVGSLVFDKVGFYGSYWHDAAIVQGKKATYALVVFTSGAGPSAIKDLAAQIQQTLNQ